MVGFPDNPFQMPDNPPLFHHLNEKPSCKYRRALSRQNSFLFDNLLERCMFPDHHYLCGYNGICSLLDRFYSLDFYFSIFLFSGIQVVNHARAFLLNLGIFRSWYHPYDVACFILERTIQQTSKKMIYLRWIYRH